MSSNPLTTVDVSRRAFLGFSVGGAAMFALSACAAGGAAPTANPSATPEFGADLRLSLYGTAERQAKVDQVLKMYASKFGGSVATQVTANAGYAEKLATEMAGGAAADDVALFHNIVADYARKDVLVNLDDWKSVVDTSGFDQAAIESGYIDGKRVALPLGDNAYAAFYDQARLDSFGVKTLEPGHSWDDFIKFANDVTKKAGGDYYGTIDASGDMNLFEVWLRQQGKTLYSKGGLGFKESDAEDWFQLWEDLRADGAAPPAGLTAESIAGGFGTALLVTGQASNFFIYGNVFKGFTGLTPSTLTISTPPMPSESKSGLFVRASNWIAAYSRGKNIDDAVNVIDFVLNDSEAVTTLGPEFGAPPNLELRSSLTYEPADQAFIDYVDLVAADYAQPIEDLSATFPEGAPKVMTLFVSTSQEIAAGSQSVKDGAASFVTQAESFVK